MPLGPLQLIDETSIDLGVRIAKATRAAMGDAYPDGVVDEVLFPMAEAGRLGRKAKAGFYAYDDKGERKGLWPELATRFPAAEDQPDLIEVRAPPPLRAGARGGARARGGRADRHPRGRRGRDPRLGLRALVGRAVLVARHAGRALCGRAGRGAGGPPRRPLRAAARSCATWPSATRPSTAASPPPRPRSRRSRSPTGRRRARRGARPAPRRRPSSRGASRAPSRSRWRARPAGTKPRWRAKGAMSSVQPLDPHHERRVLGPRAVGQVAGERVGARARPASRGR